MAPMSHLSPLSRCEMCPRRCGVDRLAGAVGYCKAGRVAEVFRYGPHEGEEPPISGTRGSGTIFFSRCTMACLYCQNHPWSQEGKGKPFGADDLMRAMLQLRDNGCHNWNLVSPTPWLPMILEALDRLARDGVSLPVVMNTSGYERVETLAAIEEKVDIYLTDLRYSREDSARLASGAGDYVRHARSALLEMWRQKGPLRLDDEGVAAEGTICRLLVLPGLHEEAIANLRWLREHVGTGIAVSVMAQYVPAHRAREMSPWNRRVAEWEYAAVRSEAEAMGFAEGWIQDLEEPAPKDLLGFEMSAGDGTASVREDVEATRADARHVEERREEVR